MPTTITPAVETVINTSSQDLFTISTVNNTLGLGGVPQYNTLASPQTVTYSAVTANVGTAITANTATGVFGLTANVANVAYQLTGFVAVTSVPATYGWINTADNTAIGPTAPAGTPLSTTFVKSSANAANVALQVTTVSGEAFAYPAQIQGAAATVSELSGYVVA
jgi:phosphoribosylcarboxyaminoimidazole (NCAIR) mutase